MGADIIIGVLDPSDTSSLGFAQESGIPFELGLIQRRYVGKTFSHQEPSIWDGHGRVTRSGVKNVLKGKRVGVVDDSIANGSILKNS
ncbi:MAG: hypothetical protein JSW58_15030 [Candidatus Latescibacterota bacterium]|nr:MAG: hypothetical protein JSW58_15030 [Candidatus Latescibacterota bacterium]